ncbi:MAG TPA: type I-C CRISPR-associated protein Cas8c/Csd1 [Thermoanaerobaculia bacterium]|nr:type I-C CRISPR-associated protein Cas8c/Csd1 [Thermoanaerobaculia bacterium]
MLDLLVQYARSHNLVAEPGFAPKTARWSLVLEPRRGSIEVLDLSDEGSPGRTFAKCPELSQPEIKRGGAGCRHFLVDSADVVVFLADEPDDPKLRAKHAYFTNLLRQASAVLPRLADMAAVLDDDAALERIRDTLRSHKAKPTDKVTFAILGETPLYPVDSDLWHDWWRTFRRSLGAESRPGKPAKRTTGEAELVRCLASGELVEPVPTHPKIAGLSDVGGLSMGDALASFKQESFCSYGLSQSANAPVSEEMAAAYRAALNHLIAEHSRRLAKVKVVHWFKDRIAAEDDPVSWLFAGEEADERAAQRRARELLDAFHTGQRPDLLANRYYALTLSGAAGRVMVRDWMEGQLDELVARIDAWFEDLSIVRRDGTGLARSPKFMAVLGGLVRDLRDLPAPWETMMWRVAVRGGRIPGQAHAAALGRLKIDILQNEPFNHARVGLLKAFHVRQGDSAMQPNLNEEHPEPAYQCGRLMAVLAALQYRALGDVGAGVVQRYYAAASSTPALVLGRLTRTAHFHLNKLDPGLARWFENRLAGIWNEIRDRVPPTLTLEEQSLFALGYYQQIAADRQRPQTTPAQPEAGVHEPTTQETAP